MVLSAKDFFGGLNRYVTAPVGNVLKTPISIMGNMMMMPMRMMQSLGNATTKVTDGFGNLFQGNWIWIIVGGAVVVGGLYAYSSYKSRY